MQLQPRELGKSCSLKEMPHLKQVNLASNFVPLDEGFTVLLKLSPVGLHTGAPEAVPEYISPQVKVRALRRPAEPAEALVIHSGLHRKRPSQFVQAESRDSLWSVTPFRR